MSSDTRRPVWSATANSVRSRRPVPRGEIGDGEQGLGLRPIQKGDWFSLVALTRHREDTLTEQSMGGLHQRHVAEERVDRGEAGVAGPGAVSALFLDMIEELTDERRFQILGLQVRGGIAESFRGKLQQETERVAVSRDGVSACLSLPKQAIQEEGLQKGLEAGGDYDRASFRLSINRSLIWLRVQTGPADQGLWKTLREESLLQLHARVSYL